jgi:predicted phosphodiesterase
MSKMNKLARLAGEASKYGFDENGAPLDPANITAQDDRDAVSLEFSRKLARGGRDAEDIAAMDDLKDFLQRIREATTSAARRAQLELLYQAFRRFSVEHRQSFEVTHEDPVYLTAANASANRGFKVVVYGHTHLVKRVPIGKDAVYLNTGTWADLIRLPVGILTGDQAAAIAKLDTFVDDMLNNNVDTWRHQVPTFARIELADDSLTSADVFFFNKDGSTERVSDGRLSRVFQ